MEVLTVSGAGGTRDEVERLAEEFVERLRRGERPTIEEYVIAYPSLAEGIRGLFSTLLLVEDIGVSSATQRRDGASTGSLRLGILFNCRVRDDRPLLDVGARATVDPGRVHQFESNAVEYDRGGEIIAGGAALGRDDRRRTNGIGRIIDCTHPRDQCVEQTALACIWPTEQDDLLEVAGNLPGIHLSADELQPPHCCC